MRIKSVTFSVFFTLLSLLAWTNIVHAHGAGHGVPREPVTQQQAETLGLRTVSTLVQRGVIEKSWSDIPVQRAEKKGFSGQMEWVVSFENKEASDPEKQILYVFLTLAGEYIGANFTGE